MKAPLTPEEAAQVLKISKYTIYEWIKRGDLPAQKVGRQLRIDPDDLYRWQAGKPSATEVPIAEWRFVGSHDPSMELLLDLARHATPPIQVITEYKGSMEGLIALYKREADLVGVHLWDERTDVYNLPHIGYFLPNEKVSVVNLVQRVQGWILQPGNPRGFQGIADLIPKKLRLVNRQKGSGTRLRLDALIREAGLISSEIAGFEDVESTHFGVAYKIATGEADVGIGVQAAADRMGLDFIPLFTERYDIVCLADIAVSQKWRQLVSIMRSPAFLHAVQQQPGYDTSRTGTIILEGE